MNDEELNKIYKILAQALHHEVNVTYEFTNNDYHCARSQAEISNDPYYSEMALRLRDDVDKIVSHHEKLINLLKTVIIQAKHAKNGVSHDDT